MKPFFVILIILTFIAVNGLIRKFFLHTGGNITATAFAQIQDGMTETEVEEILGGLASHYGHVCFCGPNSEIGIFGEWTKEREAITVIFYKGKACEKRMGATPSPYGRQPSIRSPLWRIQRIFGPE